MLQGVGFKNQWFFLINEKSLSFCYCQRKENTYCHQTMGDMDKIKVVWLEIEVRNRQRVIPSLTSSFNFFLTDKFQPSYNLHYTWFHNCLYFLCILNRQIFYNILQFLFCWRKLLLLRKTTRSLISFYAFYNTGNLWKYKHYKIIIHYIQ